MAESAGLTARIVSGGDARKQYILETTGTGVAIFDYDNDDLPDVFIANATSLDGDGDGGTASGHLYRNRGQLRFEDVTARAGLTRVGWGQGVCAADYDSDGHRDLLVTYFGQTALYRNEGDGTFRDVAATAGIASIEPRWDTGCSFFDFDLDGRLDLIVTSYLKFDRARVPAPGATSYCQWKGMPVMCGPRGLPFSHNRLFHNEGGGRFVDVSEKSGIAKSGGCYGFTAVSTDVDADGYPDVFVACDSTPSLLYRNQRDGTFEESGLLAGVALNDDGQEQGGMGVAVADYDEDGGVDIAKTNFSDDVPNLFHNDRTGLFEDRVFRSGLGGYHAVRGLGHPSPRRRSRRAQGSADDEWSRLSRSRAAARSPLSAAEAALLERWWRALQGHLSNLRSCAFGAAGVARIRGGRSRRRRQPRGGGEQSRRSPEPVEKHGATHPLAARAYRWQHAES